MGALAVRADAVALNPQPLPPGVHAGLRAAAELLRTASVADRLGIDARFDLDDWCGTPPRRPPFVRPPAPWPPVDPRGPLPDPWEGYHVGPAAGRRGRCAPVGAPEDRRAVNTLRAYLVRRTV